MIAFQQHTEAVEFVDEMEGLATQLHSRITISKFIVSERAALADALCVPAKLVLVSAHGKRFVPDKPFEPWVGGEGTGKNLDLWLRLRDFPTFVPGKIGAQAGIIWDVRNAGRPAFREMLQGRLAMCHRARSSTGFSGAAWPYSPADRRWCGSNASPVKCLGQAGVVAAP